MNWFDPSGDVVIRPEVDRARFWKRRYGAECIEVAPQVLFANNGMGRLFDAVCQELDRQAEPVHDRREQGYCHFQTPTRAVTVYRAPEPALPDGDRSKKQNSGALRFIIDIMETLILALVLFLGINAISARIRVDGNSMEPTLQSGELLIVNKLAYKLGKPEVGDVIVFQYPRNPEEEYIKRVIGLPGDTVSVSRGEVYVNGERLDEPYIAAAAHYESTWEVPENSLFVLGDNRNNSSDSHDWGSVGMDYVIGKAILIYWPPEQWGFIEHFFVANAAQ